MLENEIWKDIPHYEGLYLVSNYGRVFSLRKKKVMANCMNNDGYYQLTLWNKNSKKRTERVNRLVALAFVPNPNKYPEVNHLNGVRTDNRAENLEWCTHSENNHYKTVLNTTYKTSKPIICIETGEKFGTFGEASRVNGGHTSNIRKSAQSDGYYSVYGYHYKYIEDLED